MHNGRHRKKLIHSLIQEEGLIEGHEDLKSYITSYYKCLFGRPEDLPTARHLALQIGNQLHIDELSKYKNLRTILLFGHCESNSISDLVDNMLAKSRSIRVLDLSHVEVLTNMLPNIASMRELRFLDLSFTRVNNFRNFPCSLQVLYLRGYTRNFIPQSINMLAKLGTCILMLWLSLWFLVSGN
jgi:hypothetical protein